MKCVIIDDDSVQRQLIRDFTSQFDDIEVTAEFSSSAEAMNYFQGNEADLIILDVEMPLMSGVEFLEQFNPKSRCILISSSDKYAVNGFHLEVDDYLLKPITFARFTKAVQRVRDRMKQQHNGSSKHLFIKDKGVFQKILIDEILYVQSASEYVTIYTEKKRTMLYSSMDGILSKLTPNFMRIHRSYIVNLDRIDKVIGNMVEINGQQINISKTYHDQLMDSLGLRAK